MKRSIMLVVLGLFCFIPMVNAEDTYEAQIGDTKYATVSDAITAAGSGDEIVLLSDTGSMTVSNDKNIILNLNGKTVNNITNSGNLTIKGNGTVSYNLYYDGINNNENAVLVIDGVSFKSDGTGIQDAVVNSGTLTIKNMNCGSVDNRVSECIVNASTGTATIDGGSFYADKLFSNSGVLIINEGIFEGDESKNSSSLTINGGKFNSTNKNDSLIGNTRGSVVINGGEFTGYRVAENYDGNYLWNSGKIPSTITVNSGDFNVTGTVFDNTTFSDYSTITINGGNVVTQGKLIASQGKDNNNVYINGGTLTYNGTDNDKAFFIEDHSLVIGSNDGNVSSTQPVINLNGGRVADSVTANLEYYDGKFILKSKLNDKFIIPEGYYVKYDQNNDSTYTAYLAKVESEQPVAPEEPKEDEPVVDDTEKEEVDTPVEEETNVETTVENPPTGMYLSVGILVMIFTSVVGFITLKKKNYFNKI